MLFRSPRPAPPQFDSLGLQSNFQSSWAFLSGVFSARKLYTQPSPPGKIAWRTSPSTATDAEAHCPSRMFSPGELSAQISSPCALSRAMKLGASGAGMFSLEMSTPLAVQTKSRSPAEVASNCTCNAARCPVRASCRISRSRPIRLGRSPLPTRADRRFDRRGTPRYRGRRLHHGW